MTYAPAENPHFLSEWLPAVTGGHIESTTHSHYGQVCYLWLPQEALLRTLLPQLTDSQTGDSADRKDHGIVFFCFFLKTRLVIHRNPRFISVLEPAFSPARLSGGRRRQVLPHDKEVRLISIPVIDCAGLSPPELWGH